MNERYLRRHKEELSASRAIITPVCIVVDTSHSMGDGRFIDYTGRTRIQRLNDGIQQFLEEVKKDDALVDSLEIAIVTFNNEAQVTLPFSTIDNISRFSISAGSNAGDTPKGVDRAFDLLKSEKEFLKKNKREYYQPWIVIMSDGRASVPRGNDVYDLNRRLARVQDTMKVEEKNGKLVVIPVFIGENTGLSAYEQGKKQMEGFTNKGCCVEIGTGATQVTFKDFFARLRQSISVSDSNLVLSKNQDADIDLTPSISKGDYISKEDVEKIINEDSGYQVEKSSSKKTVSDDKKLIDEMINQSYDVVVSFDKDEHDQKNDETLVEEESSMNEENKGEQETGESDFKNANDDFLRKLLEETIDWDNV